jgi:DNA-binding LacI/PurR family transcriptional regulator
MTKQETAAQAIRDWIGSGKYAPGAQLPPIAEMAKALNLTSQPVRQAIAILARENLVYTVNGRGTFVADENSKCSSLTVLVSEPRALSRGRDDPSWFLLPEIFSGISRAAERERISLTTCFSSDFSGGYDPLFRRMREERSLGLILVSVFGNALISACAEKIGLHRVVRAHPGDFPTFLNEVKLDYRPGMFALLQQAYDYGHREFAFLYGVNVTAQYGHLERYRCAVDFLQEHGLSPQRMIATRGTAMDGYRATLQLLEKSPETTLIFAVTDERAKGVLQALRDKGVTPGKEISVIGFDDMPEAAELELATVRAPRDLIGEKAVEILRRGAAEKLDRQEIVVPTIPVPRSSLGINRG